MYKEKKVKRQDHEREKDWKGGGRQGARKGKRALSVK